MTRISHYVYAPTVHRKPNIPFNHLICVTSSQLTPNRRILQLMMCYVSAIVAEKHLLMTCFTHSYISFNLKQLCLTYKHLHDDQLPQRFVYTHFKVWRRLPPTHLRPFANKAETIIFRRNWCWTKMQKYHVLNVK